MDLNEIVNLAHENARQRGFWDDEKSTTSLFVTDDAAIGYKLDQGKVRRAIPQMLCLTHAELSEALAAYRIGDMTTRRGTYDGEDTGKPLGFPSELADVVIYVANLAGALGIDLDHEVQIKMAYNATRPRKHGKVC